MENLDALANLPEAEGTTLICPFDSFLWQRKRAEDLLGYRYRVEIYVPPARREFGYYVISEGGQKPYRLKIRSTSFSNLSILPWVLKGALVPDLVAIMGSLDFVLGDVDR